jgi:hypothetical protein
MCLARGALFTVGKTIMRVLPQRYGGVMGVLTKTGKVINLTAKAAKNSQKSRKERLVSGALFSLTGKQKRGCTFVQPLYHFSLSPNA